jgi:hypothetical protein
MRSGRRQRDREGRRPKSEPQATHRQRPPQSLGWVFLVPLLSALGLAAVAFVPRVQSNQILARSFWTASIALLVWHAILYLRVKSTSAAPLLPINVRPQHYLQAAVQLAVFAYWGYFWRPVYDHLWLLLAQVMFAYGFDMLLSWSRRGAYTLGFGPLPIIFSTNLFLWFRDDWFYLQFVMIAIGFMGKEFVRWNRDGRRVHIFNPSAFSLALFSLALIGTNTTDLTWGQDIATTLTLAPRIYGFLFLIGLLVMYFFSITLIAGAAAIVLFGLSGMYSIATGVPYFIDSEIPTAVFLGLHLLVTDPSTSPRTPVGKLVFGVLYGVGVFGLYSFLGAVGVPTFYDKLLCVPLLNLSVRGIDRLVHMLRDRWVGRRSLDILPARANLAFMSVWVVFFLAMTAMGKTDGTHRGDTIPFWEQACADGRLHGCDRLMQIESSYCNDNSGWACNELGRAYWEGTVTEADSELAVRYFSRACELRFQAGCLNLLEPGRLRSANPRVLDLRLLLREGGANLMEMSERELHARACEHGWAFACGDPSTAGTYAE